MVSDCTERGGGVLMAVRESASSQSGGAQEAMGQVGTTKDTTRRAVGLPTPGLDGAMCITTRPRQRARSSLDIR
jgi:hypothetical protein